MKNVMALISCLSFAQNSNQNLSACSQLQHQDIRLQQQSIPFRQALAQPTSSQRVNTHIFPP